MQILDYNEIEYGSDGSNITRNEKKSVRLGMDFKTACGRIRPWGKINCSCADPCRCIKRVECVCKRATSEREPPSRFVSAIMMNEKIIWSSGMTEQDYCAGKK